MEQTELSEYGVSRPPTDPPTKLLGDQRIVRISAFVERTLEIVTRQSGWAISHIEEQRTHWHVIARLGEERKHAYSVTLDKQENITELKQLY